MSQFFARIRFAFARFMQGRHGIDHLGRATALAAFALSVVGVLFSLTPAGRVLTYAAFAFYAVTLARALSRNNEARWRENAKYTQLMGRFGLWRRQTAAKLRNIRQYKYFKCPACGAPLRLRRGSGEGTVTCGKCGHQFRMKA